MAQGFPLGLDLLGSEFKNGRAHNLTTDPTPATSNQGQVWFDSVNKLFKWSDGTNVIDPRNRANHTSTQTASTISDLATTVKAYKLSDFAAPTAAVGMNAQQFSSLGTASSSGQAVEYAQFQTALTNIQTGMDFKEHVDIVALANTSISSPGATINGRTMASGDRVLLTAQTTTSQNGLWVWSGSSSALTRPTDAPTGNTSSVVAGTVVEGYNATSRTLYMQTSTGTGTNNAIIVDTDAQTWTNPFTAAPTAGYGISVTSGKVAFIPGTGMASAGADGASAGIDTTVVGRKVGGNIPTATTGIFTVSGSTVTINHALSNSCPLLVVRAGSTPPSINGNATTTGQILNIDNVPTDANNLQLTFTAAPSSNNYTFTIVG